MMEDEAINKRENGAMWGLHDTMSEVRMGE